MHIKTISLRLYALIGFLACGSGVGLVQAQMQVQLPAAQPREGVSMLAATAEPVLPQAAAAMGPQSNNNVLPKRPDLGTVNSPDAVNVPLTPIQVRKPQLPNQFQRFVQESTGKLLPLFGANLFDNPLAYATDSAALAPPEYVLGPGDEVRIQISGVVDYVGNAALDRSGRIHLPKVGPITLGGVTVKDLEPTLRKHVATVFTNVSVSASLGRLRGVTVYVVGHAQQPGTYNLSSLSTLVNAVFASGGPSANGSMRKIELKRGGKTVTTLDLYEFIAKGDKSKDASLQSGDVIAIAPAGPRVALIGATDHAAIYELTQATAVQDILALGGGLPTLANAQKAVIERIESQQERAPRQVQTLALNAQGLAHVLRDGDLLTLLPISPAFSNAVTLQGTVAQPLRHAWREGMRVQDLIPERDALITPDYYRRKNQLVQNLTASDSAESGSVADGESIGRAPSLDKKPKNQAGATLSERVRSMVDQINWDYSVIERLNKQELRTEIIAFNLGKAVLAKDPEHNVLLQAGDVVTVISSSDLQMPGQRKTRLVRVEGEVATPGIYQLLPGETLPQLLERAGGLTAQAYLFGTEFTRESVRKQQQSNLDQVIRRLEAQLQSASATLAANLGADRAAQSQALQQQQQQQMQSQLSRLKALRSKGRVSLELNSDPALWDQVVSQVQRTSGLKLLPSIPMEDGDAVVVPSWPAFVSAVGSVNNENVILYKNGKTVGDVMASAGLSEDAEPAAAFVLRADGSVVGRKHSSGWFSSLEGLRILPGDTVIVPTKIDRESGYNFIVRALRDWTQIFSNLGIGAAAIKSLQN